MDDEFWKVSKELEKALIEHINKIGIGINEKRHHNNGYNSLWQRIKSMFNL